MSGFKLKTIGLLIGLMMVSLISCDNRDVMVEVGPTLSPNDYEGEYLVTITAESGYDTSVIQWIEWTFGRQNFWMKATRIDERPKIICNASGNYKIESNITFSGLAIESGNCNSNDLPRGEFSIKRSLQEPGIDSLIMEQKTGSTKKEIRLARRYDSSAFK